MNFCRSICLFMITGIFLTVSGQDQGVAVVELFTSQGCSSCPAADANLSELVEESLENGVKLYPLAFHVDYWDRLGWKDIFSSADYSGYQREYAQVFKASQIYTPQVIVNGSRQFAGSDKSMLRAVVAVAQGSPAPVKVKLSTTIEGNVVSLDIQLNGSISGKLVRVALTENDITTNIKSGENIGKTIRYDCVVRQWKTFDATTNVYAQMAIPENVNRKNAELIVYIQDPENLHILGASSAVLR